MAGMALVDIGSSAPRVVQGIGAKSAVGQQVWLANLTGEVQEVKLWGSLSGKVAILDGESFLQAASSAEAMNSLEKALNGQDIRLGPYAVARIRF